MGAIFSACGSCLGSCCGSMACGCCKSLMPDKKSHSTIPYFIIFALAVIAAIVLRYTNSSIVDLYTVKWEVCDSTKCVGFGAVYRISFALTLFFLIHALCACLSFLKNVFVAFCWKLLFFFGLIVAAFAIPSPFYDDAYVNIARFASAIFLFFQIVLLIDFAYAWNEKWTADEANESSNAKKIGVLVVAAVFMIASIVLWAFYFKWFGENDCHRNNFFIAWTIVSCVGFTLLAISPWLEVGGGILPSAVLTIYSTWLLYSSLQSDPSSCNTLKSNDTLQLILGLIMGACSMIYAAYNVATSESLFSGGDKVEAVQAEPDIESNNGARATESRLNPEPASPSAASKSNGDEELSEEAVQQLQRRDIKFHFMMCAASMYIAMLLTTWGSSQMAVESQDPSAGDEAYDQNVENVWIKIATQWATMLTFIWTLIAPKVCTSRDFS